MLSKIKIGRHPLEGEWRSDEWEYDNVVYQIRFSKNKPVVTGIDEQDGEKFIIKNILWNGQELKFTSLMPSTKWEVEHVFSSISKDKVEHRSTKREQWIRTKRRNNCSTSRKAA
jgi:hypothetical protein